MGATPPCNSGSPRVCCLQHGDPDRSADQDGAGAFDRRHKGGIPGEHERGFIAGTSGIVIDERRDKHLLFGSRGGVCEWPEVQCIRRSRKSPRCGETDRVSSTVNQFRQCLSLLNEFPDRGVGFG